MRIVLALLLVFSAFGQSVDLRITAQTLSASTATALFGKLPKGINVASVQICSQSAEASTVSLARVVQQVKLSNNWTILPGTVAITVVASAQGSTTAARIMRGANASVQIASGLVVGKVIPLNGTWALVLSGAAFAGQLIIPAVQGAIPTHALVALSTAQLPDLIQLQPLGCTTGLNLVEQNTQAKTLDFGMTLPILPPPVK